MEGGHERHGADPLSAFGLEQTKGNGIRKEWRQPGNAERYTDIHREYSRHLYRGDQSTEPVFCLLNSFLSFGDTQASTYKRSDTASGGAATQCTVGMNEAGRAAGGSCLRPPGGCLGVHATSRSMVLYVGNVVSRQKCWQTNRQTLHPSSGPKAAMEE